MTRIIIILLISILSLLSCASHKQTQSSGIRLTVNTPNIKNNGGTLYYNLYNSKENFDKKIPFQSKSIEVKNNKATVVFKNVPQGTYAISCFYDTNNNQQLDFEGYIPTEDFGVSNNPQLFAPPSFEQLQFEIHKEDKELMINLQ